MKLQKNWDFWKEQSLKIEQIAREHGMNRSGLTRQFRGTELSLAGAFEARGVIRLDNATSRLASLHGAYLMSLNTCCSSK